MVAEFERSHFTVVPGVDLCNMPRKPGSVAVRMVNNMSC